MDRQQIGLKLTLDALGLPARLGSFSDRLILQKTIYLAQAAGVQLGYHYNWYLRGPYSPALTHDAFPVVAEVAQGENDSEGWKLDEASLLRLQRLQPLLQEADTDKLAARLELLASLHFLLQSTAGQNKTTTELRSTLQRYGKYFSEREIQDGLEQLKKYVPCAEKPAK
jgi:uncharacterized protein YwgA